MEGGSPRDQIVENHFPSGILQWNLYHVSMHYKKKNRNSEEKMLYRFEMEAK